MMKNKHCTNYTVSCERRLSLLTPFPAEEITAQFCSLPEPALAPHTAALAASLPLLPLNQTPGS